MALPREMAPRSRSMASWSSEVATCWSLLIEAKTYPPYTLSLPMCNTHRRKGWFVVSRRIEGLPTEQLEKVREFERNNKNRETLIEQIDRKIRANNNS
jgi:hypothetical protein